MGADEWDSYCQVDKEICFVRGVRKGAVEERWTEGTRLGRVDWDGGGSCLVAAATGQMEGHQLGCLKD